MNQLDFCQNQKNLILALFLKLLAPSPDSTGHFFKTGLRHFSYFMNL